MRNDPPRAHLLGEGVGAEGLFYRAEVGRVDLAFGRDAHPETESITFGLRGTGESCGVDHPPCISEDADQHLERIDDFCAVAIGVLAEDRVVDGLFGFDDLTSAARERCCALV